VVFGNIVAGVSFDDVGSELGGLPNERQDEVDISVTI